ncbi:hypothetical protein AJ79_10112 [Helicocarpus griseus UAMH5409]|uniref:Uncharacterized protein n=1 Tax=Helicocarpus griseus UAMH5409 TaxID=1447875 RepID=A0A2B7WFP4_9EURO|nr:hypothetical protein AJ79_10112 [Helicocarpus griseus UAMH5409]
MNFFAVHYLAGRGTVVLVTADAAARNDTLYCVGKGNKPNNGTHDGMDSNSWMSDDQIKTEQLLAAPNSWKVTTSAWSQSSFIFSTDNGDPVHLSAPVGSTEEREDVTTLKRYYYEEDPSESSLRLYLNTESHWHNSSWARNLKIEILDPNCAIGERTTTALEQCSVDHCLSQKVDERCQLKFNLPICLIAILRNLIKVVCMVLAAHVDRKEIFMTIGDAMASFLTEPDPTTDHRSYLSYTRIKRWRHGKGTRGSLQNGPFETAVIPQVLPGKKRWMQAVTFGRWMLTWFSYATVQSLQSYPEIAVLTLSRYILVLAASATSLYMGIRTLQVYSKPSDLAALWNLGFGNPTATAKIYLPYGTTIRALLLANTPQLVMSVVYLFYNNVLTSILLSAEYEGYARSRKHLRVSWPWGDQSIFYTEVRPYDNNIDGRPSFDPYPIIPCGYSPLAHHIRHRAEYRAESFLARLGDDPGSVPSAVGAEDDHALKPIMWGKVCLSESDSARAGSRSSSTRETSFADEPFNCHFDWGAAATKKGLYKDEDGIEYVQCTLQFYIWGGDYAQSTAVVRLGDGGADSAGRWHSSVRGMNNELSY